MKHLVELMPTSSVGFLEHPVVAAMSYRSRFLRRNHTIILTLLSLHSNSVLVALFIVPVRPSTDCREQLAEKRMVRHQ